MNERTELLIGNEKLNKLKKSHVAVFGIGGVGGYVCEMLVRAGVGEITIVDFDVVDKTNINRQIIALNSTIGKNKVDAMQSRLLDINKQLVIHKINKKFCDKELEMLNDEFDFVIDAIDDIANKVLLIKTAKNLNLNIVSAMGAGNRFDIPQFRIDDIFKTYNDGLAKILRKKLREENVVSHNVVFAESKAEKLEKVGSISYYPSMCGCVMAAYVINEIIKNKEGK